MIIGPPPKFHGTRDILSVVTRAITGALSADGRPQVHPAIATIDVSTMLNSPKASPRISTSKRFLDESGYTSGYT
jgi:hypothetical protein